MMKNFIRYAAATASVLIIAASSASACTGLTLKARNGATVYGRTLEWGAFDLHSEIIVVPRGISLSSQMEDGGKGAEWTSRHGVVAINGIGKPFALDGVNEAGLAAGLFYHPGYASYAAFDPAQRENSIGPLDVGGWILTQFATVEEVREAIGGVRVVPVAEEALGFAPPVHMFVTDRSGAAIVIEFIDGETVVHDAPLGVITNSPTYDWHMTNLRNYVNLSPVAVPTQEIDDIDFAPLGAGSGMIGLPGDFTPPSRFVRAVAFSQTARPTADGPEAIYELLRILDNFNVPLGSAEGSDVEDADGGQGGDLMRSATVWTTAIDTRNLVLHYHTAHNRRVRAVDLKSIDFDALDKVVTLPLDKERAQDIEMIDIGQ